MAYTAPAFMVSHPSDSIGISAISDANSQLTDDSKRALIDTRLGRIASFTTSVATHAITLDFTGFTFLANHLVIPSGHNITGTVEALSGATSGTVISRGSTVAAAGAAIEVEYSGGFTDAVHRVDFEGTGQWSLGELWIGFKRTVTIGRVDPGFARGFDSPRTVQELPTRDEVLQLGPRRRRFSIRIRSVEGLSLGGAFEKAVLDSVARVGRFRPFLYWPPDTDELLKPVLVQLESDARITQDFPVPAAKTTWQYEFQMVEVTS